MKASIFSGMVGLFGGTLSYLFGGWDVVLTTLVIFLLADYLMGFLIAAVLKKSDKSQSGALDSYAGWKGLVKKGVTLGVVLVAHQLDKVIGSTFIRDAVVVAFIANEAVSIIENAGLMGVPIPAVIVQAIEVLKKKGESHD